MTNLWIMFVDICGSMQLYVEQVMNTRCCALSDVFRAGNLIVIQYCGDTVERRGDGILCAFSDVDAGFEAARSIIQDQPHRSISVHGGIHWGAVISQHGAVFGDTINEGAWIANLAKGDEIILSENAWQQLSGEHRAMTRKLGKVRLIGKPQPFVIYLALFSQSDITKKFIPTLSAAHQPGLNSVI